MTEEKKWNGVYTDSRPLMRCMAEMANVDQAGIRRMVLDLRLDSTPTLYVETFLDVVRARTTDLPPVEVKVIRGAIETTSILNKEFHTHAPAPAVAETHELMSLLREFVMYEEYIDDKDLCPVRDRLFQAARDYLETHTEGTP